MSIIPQNLLEAQSAYEAMLTMAAGGPKDPRWTDSIEGLENFIRDMGYPTDGAFRVIRVDPDKPWTKANCKWNSDITMGRTPSIYPRSEYRREYVLYRDMLTRCNKPSSKSYHLYGGRGLKVLYRDFEHFMDDIGPITEGSHAIGRRDETRHYEPGNCFWAESLKTNGGHRGWEKHEYEQALKSVHRIRLALSKLKSAGILGDAEEWLSVEIDEIYGKLDELSRL